MPVRYEIEDITAQWESGVIYRARNPEGISVALRRLMLPPKTIFAMEENSFFDDLLSELKSLKCESLRSVTDGGRDEVDRVPWLTEELPEGESLNHRLEAGDLNQAEKQAIWDHGNHVISQLGKRAQLISFHPRDIILSKYDDGTITASFCMDYRDFFISRATQSLLGKKKNPLLDLQNLVCDQPSTPPVTSKSPASKPADWEPLATTSLASANSGGGSGIWISLILLVLIVGGGIFYLVQKKRDSALVDNMPPSQKTNPTQTGVSKTEPSPTDAKLSRAVDDPANDASPISPENVLLADVAPKTGGEPVAAPVSQQTLGANIFHANDMALLAEKKGDMVTIQGLVQGVSASKSNKTVYINFGWDENFVNGEILLSDSGGAKVEDFTAFENKTIRITGVLQKNFRQQIIINFSTLNAIEIVPETKK